MSILTIPILADDNKLEDLSASSFMNEYTTVFQQLEMTVNDPLRYKKMFSSFLVSHDSITVGKEIGRGAYIIVEKFV